VGAAELESATSCMSSKRSNQLSYAPVFCFAWAGESTNIAWRGGQAKVGWTEDFALWGVGPAMRRLSVHLLWARPVLVNSRPDLAC
jgi:hypothetical protein